jgi:hypothetical protein
MDAKTRIRGVNDRLRKEAVHVAGLAPSAELVKTVARDEDVRAAAKDLLSRAERLRSELSQESGRMGRLARDPGLQGEIAALIRSTAGALDATKAAGHRRSRRRVFRFLFAATAAVGVALWARSKASERRQWNEVDQGAAFAEQTGTGGQPGTGRLESVNGTSQGLQPDNGQPKPTPADASAQVDGPGA